MERGEAHPLAASLHHTECDIQNDKSVFDTLAWIAFLLP